MRTLIVGDVHGCLEELKDLLRSVSFNSDDRLIFVGDLVHKGPDSLGVLEFVQGIGAEMVLGNHELNFLRRTLDEEEEDHPLKLAMGESFDDWVDWLQQQPLFIEDPDFLVVHAGIAPNMKLGETPVRILTTIRTWDGKGEDLNNREHPPWFEFYKDDRLIVFGHWARRGLVERVNVIGLDSGCVYGKQLSLVELPARKIHSVPAKQNYTLIKPKV